eukprot:640231-Hanusia_phi.AAC.1
MRKDKGAEAVEATESWGGLGCGGKVQLSHRLNTMEWTGRGGEEVSQVEGAHRDWRAKRIVGEGIFLSSPAANSSVTSK